MHIPNEQEIEGMDWNDLDAWEHFDKVELDGLTTLDFTVLLQGTDLRWGDGEPVFLDEANGIVVMKIKPFCLSTVLRKSAEVDPEFQEDMEMLRAFLQEKGLNDIYEVSTF